MPKSLKANPIFGEIWGVEWYLENPPRNPRQTGHPQNLGFCFDGSGKKIGHHKKKIKKLDKHSCALEFPFSVARSFVADFSFIFFRLLSGRIEVGE